MARINEEDIARLIGLQPKTKVDTSNIRVPCKDRYGKANFLSKGTWCWMDPLFWTGCRKRRLEHEDLYKEPVHTESERLQKKFQKYWDEELHKRKNGGKARLWIAFVKVFWPRFILAFFLSSSEVVLQVIQAILLGLVADYFVEDVTDESTRNACLYAMGIGLCSIAMTFVHAHTFLMVAEKGMMARVMLTGTVYKKIFELSQETIGEVTLGKILNLMSYDVQRLDIAFFFTSYIIISPAHIIAVVLIMWFYFGLGATSLAGMGLLILQIPIQYLQGRLFAYLRFASAKLTDKRVRVMNEIISGIRVIKMYGWEYAFKKVIAGIRKKETRLILLASLIRAVNGAFYYVSIPIVTFLMFTTFTTTTGQPLRPSIVFSSLSLLFFLRITAVAFLTQSILGLQEVRVAFSRIQNLLLKDLPDPVKKRRYTRRPTITSLLSFSSEVADADTVFRNMEDLPEGETPSITVDNLKAAWKSTLAKENRLTLKGISFSCDISNRMIAIVGPVGAGKSSILQCLLGELKPLSGSVDVIGSLGYSSQDPWVFSGTVKENILFGQPFEEDWYKQVLKECCLDEDIVLLPHGDATLVGERGVTLSGGQKSRITLARAVYRKADVYILDDPLSAVDTVVGRRLFQTCMSGVLKNSIVVLVTHHLQYAQLADAVLVIDQGETLAYDTYEEIMNMIDHSSENLKYARMKEVLSEMLANLKNKEARAVFDVEDSSVDLEEEEDGVPGSVRASIDQDNVPLLGVENGGVLVLPNGDLADMEPDVASYLDAGLGSLYPASSQISLPSLHNLASFTSDTVQTPYHQDQFSPTETLPQETSLSNVVPKEDREKGSVTFKTYYKYFIAGGGYVGVLLLLIVFVLTEVNVIVADWWLSEWAESNRSCSEANSTNILCDFSNELIIEIYFTLVCGAVIFATVRSVFFFYVCVHSAQVLHNRMFASVLRAPVRFFDTNPIGRILNKFSKDLGFLDDVLPYQFFDYLFILLRVTAIIVVAGIANYYIFIPIVVILVTFLTMRYYYLTSARDIKRLEAVSRSPLFSHITATLQGLTTIRACERQDASVEYFHAYQDEQTKGWIIFLHASRWFGLRLDLISSFFIIVVVFLSIPLVNSLDAGLIGLSMAYTVSLAGLFQYGVRMSTEVESLMVSTERLLAYSRLTHEASLETPPGVERPDKTWPHSGSLHLHKVKFRYAKDTPYVLKGITVDAQPGEKLGIVGRTGAGKSSLLQALFRMAEPEGIIEIDGVSITDLGLHDVRQRMSIIPQDPVLFSGTVRYNLDPFTRYNDEEIWTALEQVQLKEAIEEMDHQLEAAVTESGSNFSVGQRQLICLGRALLKRNKILVIDEATANVDMTTDAIIQQTIRREFADCTTLTIAHRLNTIMDSDRIMVLSAGKIHEFDSPHELLSNPSSLLSRMVSQAGEQESERLRRIAEEKYNRKRERETASQ